jgi:hypothetical protein
MDAEPKSALETLTTHFTDSPERKEERQALADASAEQLRTAEMQSWDARDYSIIRDRIAQDFYHAAGEHEKDVVSALSRQQMADLRAYAESMPFFSTDRRAFTHAIAMAEQGLTDSKARSMSRDRAERNKVQDPPSRVEDQRKIAAQIDVPHTSHKVLPTKRKEAVKRESSSDIISINQVNDNHVERPSGTVTT